MFNMAHEPDNQITRITSVYRNNSTRKTMYAQYTFTTNTTTATRLPVCW